MWCAIWVYGCNAKYMREENVTFVLCKVVNLQFRLSFENAIKASTEGKWSSESQPREHDVQLADNGLLFARALLGLTTHLRRVGPDVQRNGARAISVQGCLWHFGKSELLFFVVVIVVVVFLAQKSFLAVHSRSPGFASGRVSKWLGVLRPVNHYGHIRARLLAEGFEISS